MVDVKQKEYRCDFTESPSNDSTQAVYITQRAGFGLKILDSAYVVPILTPEECYSVRERFSLTDEKLIEFYYVSGNIYYPTELDGVYPNRGAVGKIYDTEEQSLYTHEESIKKNGGGRVVKMKNRENSESLAIEQSTLEKWSEEERIIGLWPLIGKINR